MSWRDRAAAGRAASCCSTSRWRPSPGSASAGRPTCCSCRRTRTTWPPSSRRSPEDVPLTVLGVGSNILVRDGGVEGVVIRLAGRAFAGIERRGRGRGSDRRRRRRSTRRWRARPAKAGIAGLEFYRGVPGTIGGALHHERRLLRRRDQGRAGRGLGRRPRRRAATLSNAGRSASAIASSARPPNGSIVCTGAPCSRAAPTIRRRSPARMDEITARREATQPIREKTGGSTFKNPPGDQRLEAGRRGRLARQAARRGDVLALHANFLINTGEATAADLEGLGEAVRADVAAKTGVELEWEIKRIGRLSPHDAAGRAATAASPLRRGAGPGRRLPAQEPPAALSARRALPRRRQRRRAHHARPGPDRRGLGGQHRQPDDRRPHRHRRRRQTGPGRRHVLGAQPGRAHLDLPPAPTPNGRTARR